ncbi:Zinc transporter [Allomyces arbusculus]|nr:Zinc transporter [Allomyces arbusculus]
MTGTHETTTEPNYGLAFAVAIGAGLSTAFGAASVKFGSLQSPRFLATGMALAGGVMLYVSLLDIWVESKISFEEAWPGESGTKRAYIAATGMFFAGALLAVGMEAGVNWLETRLLRRGSASHRPPASPSVEDPEAAATTAVKDKPRSSDAGDAAQTAVQVMSAEDRASLMRTAMVTGIALTIHNIPEGLATFISMCSSVASGLPLAVAIAVHNIPEGICVAVPILYATGSKWKAFWWGTITGVSEPVGALLGFAILKSTDAANLATVYGVLFGLISGIMTYIAIAELIPTALAHHKNPRDVAVMVFAGMAIMAASLVLFEVAGA